MRSRPVVVLLFVVATFLLAAAGCGPRPLTEQEICGAQGCQSCIGTNCTGGADAGADAGP